MKQIIAEVVAEFDGVVIGVETMPDHVYLRVEAAPRVAPWRLVGILKGRSSRLLRGEFAHRARMGWLWSPSWLIAAVGGAPLEVLGRCGQCQGVAGARKRAGEAMAVRYRLYPTGEQARFMVRRHCADARLVWNLAVEQFNGRRSGRAAPGPAERQRQLAEARQALGWLAGGSSSVQQQAVRDVDRAVGAFVTGTHRRPTWRGKHQHEGFWVGDTMYLC